VNISKKRLVIARFEPLTNALLDMIRHNYMISRREDEDLVVVIGSSTSDRNKLCPLAFKEREVMIQAALKDEGMIGVSIVGLPDFPGDDRAWVNALMNAAGGDANQMTVSTRSYWTKCQCDYAGMETYEHPNFWGGLDATAVRKMICEGKSEWKALVPKSTVEYLESRIDGQMTGVEIIRMYCN
jgi:nicotinamide mononucleotide adenylyltransferase